MVGLVNHNQSQLRFVIASDRQWLFAYPSEGTLASGEGAQIAVSVSSAGMPPETNHGQFVIRRTPADSAGAGIAETVRVTFGGVPDSGGPLGETRQG